MENFKKILENGKSFIKNPMNILLGVAVTALLTLYDDVIDYTRSEVKFALLTFGIIFSLLVLFAYCKNCYDRLNEVIIEFNKAKGHKLIVGNSMKRNIMGYVRIIKDYDTIRLEAKIRFFGEEIQDEYTAEIKTEHNS